MGGGDDKWEEEKYAYYCTNLENQTEMDRGFRS